MKEQTAGLERRLEILEQIIRLYREYMEDDAQDSPQDLVQYLHDVDTEL